MNRKPENIARDIIDYYDIETVGDITWYLDEEAGRNAMTDATYAAAFDLIKAEAGL